MKNPISVSLLELAIITQDSNATETFQKTKDIAQLADTLGYKRFWLAEHHNMAHVASSATVVLIGYIASQTQNIRVGSGGIMLPKVYGRADVDKLDHCLSALEVANGIEEGSTPVIVLVTETAEAMFHTGSYKGAPRVVALTWGAEDLADSIGASSNRDADGSYSFTYELARSLTVLGAATAGVAAVETISADYKDLEALRLRAEKVRRDGFRGMLAIHPAQVDVINAAFTPSAEEVAEAREIVAIFDANPGVGAIGYKGGMLDRPYLSRALQLLAQVDPA